MSTMKVLVLFGVAATAFGQAHPRVCDSPEVWEAMSRQYDFGIGETVTAFTAHDSINRRLYRREQISGKTPGRKQYTELFLYKEGEYYKVDTFAKKCYKSRIPSNKAWRPFGVPPNATFTASVNVGIVGESFLANEYEIRPSDHPSNYYYRGVFTAKECAPVQEQIFKSSGLDISQSELIEYFNIVLGIADPNVFIPPTLCDQVSEEVMASLK